MVTAFEYEPDKTVVEVDDPPALPRVATKELEMQVYVDGQWHRRLPDLSATACGARIHSEFARPRRHELKHPLCQTCHTPVELAIADKVELAEIESST